MSGNQGYINYKTKQVCFLLSLFCILLKKKNWQSLQYKTFVFIGDHLFAAKTVSAPLWMKELSIKSFHVSRSIILIHGERNIDKSFYLFKYVYGEDEFTACKLQPDVSLCFDDGDLHPVLFVSSHQVTLPFFAVSQEHLIDKVFFLLSKFK